MKFWLYDVPVCNSSLSHRERKKQQRAQTITQMTIALSAERGFDNVTIEDIATACGISRRTFFNYFENKEEALLGHPTFDLTAAEIAQFHQSDDIAATTLAAVLHRHFGTSNGLSSAQLQQLKTILEAQPALFPIIWKRIITLSSTLEQFLSELFQKHPEKQHTDLPANTEAALTVAVVNGCVHTLHTEAMPDVTDIAALQEQHYQRGLELLAATACITQHRTHSSNPPSAKEAQ